MKIEEYFVSDEFYSAISPIQELLASGDDSTNVKYVEFLISMGIKYSIAMGENDELTTEGLSEFLYKVANVLREKKPGYLDISYSDSDVADVFLDAVFDKLGVPIEMRDNPEVKDRVNEYLGAKLYNHRYLFHGYSSGCDESIREHGLNPEYATPNQEEIDRINAIFVDHGLSAIFGWQALNCRGQVSYSETPDAAYYYATGSPEWFSHFTGETLEYHQDHYDKHAFIKNDHDLARRNILKLMTDNGFKESEMEEVLDFFERNWDRLADREPRLLVKRLDQDRNMDGFKDLISTDSFYKSNCKAVYSFVMPMGQCDLQTDEPIDVSDATFIRLPKYTDVLKKVARIEIGPADSDLDSGIAR